MVSEVSSGASGVLESIDTERGAFVKQGQVVAHLRSGVERAVVNLSRARAEFTAEVKAKQLSHQLALRNFERVSGLYAKKMIAEQEEDKTKTMAQIAEFEWRMAQEQQRLAALELKRAEEILALRVLTSPVNGVVVDTLKAPGEYVEEQPVVKIARIDPLYVEVLAPLSYYGKVAVGAMAAITLEQPVGGHYDAKVIVVDPLIDAPSGTFGIRLKLPNAEHRIPAGLNCKVTF